jgi:hypothetical protein
VATVLCFGVTKAGREQKPGCYANDQSFSLFHTRSPFILLFRYWG